MGWHYLSFAEDGFNGAAIVEADDFLSAVVLTHLLRINPGGEVLGADIDVDQLPSPQYRHVLLSEEKLTEAFGEGAVVRLGDIEQPRTLH